jgi:hypothetical protein
MRKHLVRKCEASRTSVCAAGRDIASITCRIRGSCVRISGPSYTWYLTVAFTNTTRPRG